MRWALVLLLLVGPTLARDNGQWAQADPSIRDWVRGLKDNHGVSCCDTADAAEVEMWDIDNGEYRVRVGGKWLVVPPEAVLNEPNKLGYARAWLWHKDGELRVRCFLVGPLI